MSKKVKKTINYVNLCAYVRHHGVFYTLGSRALCGPHISPTGHPSMVYKIPLDDLREIIAEAERTGEPE